MTRAAFPITAHYTEQSLALTILGILGNTTLGAVRSQVISDLARHIQMSHSFSEALDLKAESVIIASDSTGFRSYDDDDILLKDVAGDEYGIHAIVPSKKSQCAIDLGIPTEGIADHPQHLTNPLGSPWDAQQAAVTSAIQAAIQAVISPMNVELSALKVELKKEKELRAAAESDYRRMLDEEKVERIEQIADTQAYTRAVEELVIHQDTTYLNTIRLQSAVNYTQATIAWTTALSTLTSSTTAASWAFRNKLNKGGSEDTKERVKFTNNFIKNAKPSLPTHLAELLRSDEAMVLICEKESSIRKRGNTAAHLSPSTDDELSSLTAAIDQLQETSEQEGMHKIICFLQSVSLASS